MTSSVDRNYLLHIIAANDPSEDGEVDVGDEKEEKEKNDGTTGKENDIEILKVTQGTGQIIKHKKEKWIHKRRARLQME